MKRKTSSGRVLALSMILAVSSSLPAFAASWQQDSAGWRWKQDNGEYAAGGWQWLDGNHDGISECYYFNANGYMLANTTTPDGYKVDGSGAWVENGTVKTKSTSGDPGVTVPNGMWRKGAGANANKWWWQNMDGSYASGGWYWLDGDQDGIAEC
ncbi:MAG: secretory protein, partial [Clostridiales bacterium]|nr:secretory protein [Clostridiales bacterium]